jgi:hypothetical protein
MKSFHPLILLIMVQTASMVCAVAAPLATFSCREITGRDWPRTLVTYPVQFPQGQVKPERVHLVDAAGTEQPCQFWQVKSYKDGSIASGRISFYAELPKGGGYQFELQPGKPSSLAPSPTAAVKGGMVTLDNRVVALRLPAGKKSYKTPLAFCPDHATAAAHAGRLEGAGLAFGPIAGIRLADGRWVGGSYFSYEPIDLVRQRQGTVKELAADAWTQAGKSAPGVTGYETVITERGPLFTEARIRFALSNGGYYQLTARVLADDPAIHLDEVMDLMSTCQPDNPLYVCMLLNDGQRPDGWRPDCAYGYAPRSDRYKPLEEAVKAQGIKIATPDVKPASMPINYDKDGQMIAEISVLYPWGPYAHYAGLVDTAQLLKDKSTPFLGIVPQHGGSWRGTAFVFPPKTPQLFQQMLAYTNGDLEMRWTIRNSPHVQNLLHTGEYDPDFGLTGMRRIWNLVGGTFQYHDPLYRMRAVQGFVNLDNYKDWNLGWSDDTKAAVQLPPDKRPTSPALTYFNQGFEGNDDRGLKWWSHFRQAENMTWAVEARNKLADPAVSAEGKGILRAQIAAFCYLMAETDFNTRASASHQGNPNMPVNRFYALPFAAVLIPDHPMSKTWLDVTREYVKYELGLNLTLGNGYSELMTYYGAAAPTYVHAALVCEQTGRLDPKTRALALGVVDFTLPMLPPPDARYGYRIIPGFGHEGVLRVNQWLPAAALIKDVDPDLAALYAWAWKEQGQPGESQHCNGFALLTADEGKRAESVKPESIKARLKSTWIPGFGAVLHSHPGDPQETYLGYRQGYFTSHSDANQGDFVLYAKGAPLTSLSQYGYGLGRPSYQKLFKEFGWHSVVRTGAQANDAGWPGGGPVSGVHRHFFSESVDYLRGMGDYSNARVEGNSIARDLTVPDAQRWMRQILFLKGKTPASPNYFLFRESFRNLHGDASKLTPKWWYQRTVGGKELVQPTDAGFAYSSPFGAGMDVRFLQPAKVGIESRTVSEAGLVGGGGLGGFINQKGTEVITVTGAGPVPAGQDILVAIYPRGKGEAAAAMQQLADGAAKIVTAESTDYVFLNPAGMNYKDGDVTFQGTAGAVRVFPNEVHLTVAEGAGTITYKGFTLKAGKPVTRVIPLSAIAKGGAVEVAADPLTITFALDEKAGTIVDVQPGVKKQTLATGTVWLFESAKPIKFTQDGVTFDGTRGGIVVDTKAGTTRLVMLEGTKIACGSALAEVADGPYDLTFYADKVVGVAEGPARFLYLSKPAGLNAMPCITVDGVSYAPGGYSGNDAPYCTHINGQDAIIPLLGGRRAFTLENLKQPPVFRSWVRW